MSIMKNKTSEETFLKALREELDLENNGVGRTREERLENIIANVTAMVDARIAEVRQSIDYFNDDHDCTMNEKGFCHGCEKIQEEVDKAIDNIIDCQINDILYEGSTQIEE